LLVLDFQKSPGFSYIQPHPARPGLPQLYSGFTEWPDLDFMHLQGYNVKELNNQGFKSILNQSKIKRELFI